MRCRAAALRHLAGLRAHLACDVHHEHDLALKLRERELLALDVGGGEAVADWLAGRKGGCGGALQCVARVQGRSWTCGQCLLLEGGENTANDRPGRLAMHETGANNRDLRCGARLEGRPRCGCDPRVSGPSATLPPRRHTSHADMRLWLGRARVAQLPRSSAVRACGRNAGLQQTRYMRAESVRARVPWPPSGVDRHR
eukprot:362948-Chlamydomonas_euryale.AAC.4